MRTDMCLQSHKWTWTPALLIIDTAKTNAYAQHVLLCDDYNRQHKLTHKDKQYARPLTAKQFYRILGLKMIKYKYNGGYWFEDKEKARRAKVAAAPPERTHD
jgi:hypothetical protein